MSLLAGQVHCLSATTPNRSEISNVKFESNKWQAAVVLPHVRQVLETRVRKLARSLRTSVRNARNKASITDLKWNGAAAENGLPKPYNMGALCETVRCREL